jgi:hypothetical protein
MRWNHLHNRRATAFLFLLIGTIAAPCSAGPIFDLAWGDSAGNNRTNENCGTIAMSNLLLQWNNQVSGVITNPSNTDALKTEVENYCKPEVGSTNLSDAKMTDAIKAYLKAHGYNGTVAYRPMYAGETLTWNWLKNEWDNDEKLNILVEDGKDAAGNTISHWLSVTSLDGSGNLSVADPNTSPAGSADSYTVNTTGMTFELPYDFAGETNQDGKSPVKIVSAVKVSDVTPIPEPVSALLLGLGAMALLARRKAC